MIKFILGLVEERDAELATLLKNHNDALDAAD